MSELFDDNTSSSEPVGALARLAKARNLVTTKSDKRETWSEIWRARGGFAFGMKAGEKATLVVVSEFKTFWAAPLLFGWKTGGRSWPKFDYVRSPAYGENLEPNGEPCIMTEVTGMYPKLLAVAVVLDMRPYTTTDGVEKKYSFRYLIIKDEGVQQQLENISAHHGRDLKGAKIQVMRSMKDKSPSTGDSWLLTNFVEDDVLDKLVPEWREEVAARPFDKAFPLPDHELAMALLQQHVAVAEKHQGQDNKATEYNKERWAELTGRPIATKATAKTATDVLADDLEDDFAALTVGTPKGGKTPTGSLEFDGLDELDEALGL